MTLRFAGWTLDQNGCSCVMCVLLVMSVSAYYELGRVGFGDNRCIFGDNMCIYLYNICVFEDGKLSFHKHFFDKKNNNLKSISPTSENHVCVCV